MFQKGLSEDFNVSSPFEIIENCDIDVTAKIDYRTMRTLSSETRYCDRTTIDPKQENGTCKEQLRTVEQDGVEEYRDGRRAGTSE